MDVAEGSMMYIVYAFEKNGYIKDDGCNRSKGSTRNLPTNLVS